MYMNLAVLLSGLSVHLLILAAVVNLWYVRSFKKDKKEGLPAEVLPKKVTDDVSR
jgi:hypothetical protein